MTVKRLARLELQLMEALWTLGPVSVREIQEALPERNRPAYTTVQTTMYRLEEKGAVRRVRKVGNAHIFEAVLTRSHAHRRIVDDLLSVFGGRPQPIIAHLIETGRLTIDDLREAEATLRRLDEQEPRK